MSPRMNPRLLAERYGTPAYIYDLDAVRTATAALRADLPAGSGLYFSVKANPHPLVIAATGCDAEVSSLGEIQAALAAGCRPDALLHTGPGKSRAELTSSIAAGVRRFSVESRTDRDRLAEVAAEAGVQVDYLVRLNCPAAGGGGSLRMTGKPSPFGVDSGNIGGLRVLLRPSGPARPIGLHTYFATNVAGESALIAEFDKALETIAAICDAAEFTPRVIDLGGGFGAPQAQPGDLPRYPALAEGVAASRRKWLPALDAEVVFESGRHLAACAGRLVSRVLDVKRSGEKTFTVLDAGVNVLGGMSGLGRLLSPRVTPLAADESTTTTLVGPLCTPLDVLNPAAAIDAAVDDIVVIPNVGAYGLTASLIGFLSHPAPVEIVCEGDRVVSARRLALIPTEVHG